MSDITQRAILHNNAMNKKGFTLLEAMVVVALISIMFASLLSLMINSDTYWKKGMNKVYQHEEARRIIDAIAGPLREASPYWEYVCNASCSTCVNSTAYHLTVSNESDRVIFRRPVYNDDGSANTSIDAVPTPYIYRFWSANKTLQMKIGDDDPVDISSGKLTNVFFTGEDCDCSPLPCKDCRGVTINVTVDPTDDSDQNAAPFELSTHVTLRDDVIKIAIPYGGNATANSTGSEEPLEGEF